MSDGVMERGAPGQRGTPAAPAGSARAWFRHPPGRGEAERLDIHPDGPTIFGRGEECDHRLSVRFLSRRHFAVLPGADGYLLLDLESRNGTFLQDRPVRIARLEEGSILRAGSRILIFESDRGAQGARCPVCSRKLGASVAPDARRLCLLCRQQFPWVGASLDGLLVTGGRASRPGLRDYVAFDEPDARSLRLRVFENGPSRRALGGIISFAHERAIRVLEKKKHEGLTVIVTDPPPSISLATLVGSGLPAPVGLVDRAMRGVASAMAAAHAKGLLHGALRPECVGLDDAGEAVVDDLGIHDILRPEESETDWFVPPERRGTRRRSERTDDVYAFGATCYQVLTRRPPMPDFAGGRKEAARPLASRRPDLPARTAFLIGRALASDPKERYGSFEEILADLA